MPQKIINQVNAEIVKALKQPDVIERYTALGIESVTTPQEFTKIIKSDLKRASADGYDHTFKAIYERDIPWESDDVRGLLKLPPGVKVKGLNYDPVMKRLDMKQRFPPGYVEPAHTHKSWHSILVTKGRMCVAGKDLRPGDYVFGWDIPHGPYEYPDGCEACIVYMGDASHIWEKDDLLKHRNIWNPETEESKKGVDTHIKKRTTDVRSR